MLLWQKERKIYHSRLMMNSLCARSSNAFLPFVIVVALCVTLLYLHHLPNSGAGDFTGQKRYECSPGNRGILKESPLPSITKETLSIPTIKDEPFPLDIDQEDPALAAYIRRLVVPPSELPYNLTNPKQEHFSQLGQTQFLMKRIFPNTRGGFFLEVGAVNGEMLSNTLYLERRMGWRGLLIEAFPRTYQELLHKHRKAYSIQAALSLTNKSSEVKFRPLGTKGVLSSVGQTGATITVRAFPLYAILKALDVPVIDYFSLDIEGKEMEVLGTLPWDKLKVRVMHVEYNHLRGGTKELVSAMEARGMHFIGTRAIDAWFVCPELYKHTIQSVKEVKG